MADQPVKQLILQKIYIKDMSFESPKAPQIFTSQVTPQTQLNMRTNTREIAPNTHEVTLTLTVETKDQDSTLFLVEVAQSGIFTLQGYNDQERALLLGSYCPSTLYPYAREAISDVVVKGGFPPLLLQPINFDALYAQALQQRQQGGAVQANGSGLTVEGAAAPEAAPAGTPVGGDGGEQSDTSKAGETN
ncbi:MAG: protein-export chaperone SecB [Gammaproteobacteria bacterium]|nr:protein-export chaperone SecB [Gammaproteobacteria bacterium]